MHTNPKTKHKSHFWKTILKPLLTVIFLYSGLLNAQDTRLDSFTIVNYEINLDISNLTSKNIAGNTVIELTTKTDNISLFTVDIASTLTVDSVLYGESLAGLTKTTFTHNDFKLYVDVSMSNTKTYYTKIYYHGTPEMDPSGWGGFYFSGSYAFNLGVGFENNPHNYGRAWFPCFDNFVSRATYQFNITTASDDKAFCNGLLQDEVDNGNGTKTWVWDMTEPIPTYLASVAVAPYYTIKSTYQGIGGIIPIELACLPGDSTKVKSSFENLPGAIAAFETFYGEHNFSRVGFNMVPFNGGAMEHATNIAYPLSAANGSKDRETLFAHELAHHWWGNTVTCRTAEDMWINEGWASYSENIFLEYVYDIDTYKEAVSSNHYNVLRWAHLRDGEARAIHGIPHEYTYGMHVYDKGADVVHTLRGYMGKDNFINAIKAFLTLNKFSDVSSEDLRDEFQKHTSADLTAFFDNWVFEPGFPHFEIVKIVSYFNNTDWSTTITIDQKQRFTSKMYSGVPIEVTLYDGARNKLEEQVIIDGYYQHYKFNTDFKPTYIALDLEEKLSDAITDKMIDITEPGTYSFGDALMTVKATEIGTPSLVRVEHHWVGPSGETDVKGLFPSNSRYWTVDGLIAHDMKASATIIYDGRTPSSYTAGYLDHNHIKTTEDSLVLLYRPDKESKWVIHDDYTKNTGSTGDGFGSIIINNLVKGDYCFGMYDYTLGTAKPIKKVDYLEAYPNPTDGLISFKISNLYTDSEIVIVNSKGAVVDKLKIYANQNTISLDTSTYPKGVYFANLMVGDKSFDRIKFVVKH